MLDLNHIGSGVKTSLTFDGAEIKGISDLSSRWLESLRPRRIGFECTTNLGVLLSESMLREIADGKRAIRIVSPDGRFFEGTLLSMKQAMNQRGELEFECEMEITKDRRRLRFPRMNPARLPL